MNKIRASLVLAGCIGFLSASAADNDYDSDYDTLFAQGKRQLTVLGGAGSAFGEDYFVIGAGFGYYLIDGFNVGLQFESWSGGDPGILKVTASTQYVFYKTSGIPTYVGAFYRYSEFENQPSIDSVGARAGLYLPVGPSGYFGLGAVYEKYLDCNMQFYASCDEAYPEVSFTFAF